MEVLNPCPWPTTSHDAYILELNIHYQSPPQNDHVLSSIGFHLCLILNHSLYFSHDTYTVKFLPLPLPNTYFASITTKIQKLSETGICLATPPNHQYAVCITFILFCKHPNQICYLQVQQNIKQEINLTSPWYVYLWCRVCTNKKNWGGIHFCLVIFFILLIYFIQ